MRRNFTWPENGTDGRETTSLLLKTPSMYNTLISRIMNRSQFHLAGNGTDGRESISLIWKTLSVLDIDNFGNDALCANAKYCRSTTRAYIRFRILVNNNVSINVNENLEM